MAVTTTEATGNGQQIHSAAPARSTEASIDRAALRAELETTCTAFHAFLNSLSADQWYQQSSTSTWRMAEVAVHLTWGLEQLPVDTFGCRTCHGPQLAGGKDPDPAAPPGPNLTAGGNLVRSRS